MRSTVIVMESVVRPLIWLCLLAFLGLQFCIFVMKRDDVTWSELLRARLLVIYEPEKYLKRNASRAIRFFLLAFAALVIVGWVAIRWSNQQ